ncbi:MAG: DNA-binding protein [Desulfovibrio sp. MES5]|uniref:DUF134 domain-containing protein n=1 Tax=Desulfovibrio sp. MES5 TaxID=1899016 RepID=UPI000B9CB472|nr:DUF134 domain-containing protein [Desulfovibrio sp. MES5]OXS29709.1 MAG: DNA-binding protein [Desulfovibrio sp. MES5]
MPRPSHCRRVSALPKASYFKPKGIPLSDLDERILPLDGLEALRLADYEGRNMDEAAARMGVSRHTFGRLLRRARHCVAEALVDGLALRIEGGVCAMEAQDGDVSPSGSEGLLVAVPSQEPGGLEAAPHAHFGRCTVYTLASVKDGQVKNITVRANAAHLPGDCSSPVQALADMGVKVLLAGGMGVRPLRAMQAAGIAVYHNAGLPSVGACLEAFAQNRLAAFGTEHLCRGGCGPEK